MRIRIPRVRHHACAVCALSLVAFALVSPSANAEQGKYVEVENQPDCFIWIPNSQPDETVWWSGGCYEGKAEGRGKVTIIRKDGNAISSEGGHVKGDRNGRWIIHDEAGSILEGFFSNNERVGPWVERYISVPDSGS